MSSLSETRGRTRARISFGVSNAFRLELIESVLVAVFVADVLLTAPTSSASADGILTGIRGSFVARREWSRDWCCFSRLIRRRHLSSHERIVAFATSSSIKNSSSSRAIYI